ncbi:hypothetical protein I6M34_15605 [Shewanella algae]|uniref:hypothetical protein n=1 Tax=Shewanella algae TaxID=38313 RepID=UPI001AAD0941|nr:hypothetical protein [Shewanella algae]MBO2604515.1 hypothetical protein [Shewanella algae]
MSRLSVLAALPLCFPLMTQAQAVFNAEEKFEPPLVVSYAAQPVNRFNQKLLQAQHQQAPWSQDPEGISRQYSGSAFKFVRISHSHGKTLTYNVSTQEGHPQMLLILALDNNAGDWSVEKAVLSWRCQNKVYFGTDNCSPPHKH